MKSGELPEIEILQDLLEYDGERGFMVWKPRNAWMCKSASEMNRWNKRFAGRRAETSTKNGYSVVTIFNKQYKAHRVCFALKIGSTDFDVVDHINGVRSDNRAENLRSATAATNNKNRKMCRRNRSGCVGVRSKGDKFEAFIGSGQSKHIGTFSSEKDAVNARRIAEISEGYSVRK